ncbi:hypothetical protein POM88_013486 [Heracleum sosnowskyi]|uniref:DUF4005 domain-containing protein n=1 Tax=Heracleum sosnowskyi TaxID=360622 RepID=A0AAD8IYN5_9APIA|nr:hypothetical protein POM88_013486 [Heracleum sosnowskyi]
MAAGGLGEPMKAKLDLISQKARSVWDSSPQPVKSFPWNKAAESFIQLILDLVLAVMKYLSVPVLAVSSLCEMSYCDEQDSYGWDGPVSMVDLHLQLELLLLYARQAIKDLKALKGLVKIQALVRGHLVRKQTSEMLRCMNALMSIQVRARVQRIQMTEEPPIIVKRKLTHREPAHDQLRRGHSDNLNLTERRGSSRWNEDPISHQQIKTREHEFSTNYSERFLISKQELQSQVYTNPSPFTNTSSSQYKEYFYGTPNRISHQKYNVSNFGHIKAPDSPSVDYSGTTSHNSQFGHNYMANTHSSMAHLRSSSEPKQRPLKQKTMRSPSFGGINTRPDTRDQIQSSNGQKKQPPWSIKRYRAAKSSKDIEYDSNRLGTSSSSSNRTLRHTR